MADPQQLAEGVVRLGTPTVNWYLVADDSGVTVVDSGLPGYRNQLEPGLALLGRSIDDVRGVILTHGDRDHSGGAEKLVGERADLAVHLHPDDDYLVRGGRKKVEDSMLSALYHYHLYPLIWSFAINGGLSTTRIGHTIPLVDGEVVEVPGQPRVIHTPGHTEGHVVFHFPEHEALFVGDTICTWNPATNDRGPQLMRPAFNVSNKTALDSLARYEEIDAALLLVGHGEPWTEGPAAAVDRARAKASDLAA